MWDLKKEFLGTVGYCIKNAVYSAGCLLMHWWSPKPSRPPIVQASAILLGCPAELDDRTL